MTRQSVTLLLGKTEFCKYLDSCDCCCHLLQFFLSIFPGTDVIALLMVPLLLILKNKTSFQKIFCIVKTTIQRPPLSSIPLQKLRCLSLPNNSSLIFNHKAHRVSDKQLFLFLPYLDLLYSWDHSL